MWTISTGLLFGCHPPPEASRSHLSSPDKATAERNTILSRGQLSIIHHTGTFNTTYLSQLTSVFQKNAKQNFNCRTMFSHFCQHMLKIRKTKRHIIHKSDAQMEKVFTNTAKPFNNSKHQMRQFFMVNFKQPHVSINNKSFKDKWIIDRLIKSVSNVYIRSLV